MRGSHADRVPEQQIGAPSDDKSEKVADIPCALRRSGTVLQDSSLASHVAINMVAAVSQVTVIWPRLKLPAPFAFDGSKHIFSVNPACAHEGKDNATRLKTRKDLIVALETGCGGG